MLSLLPNEILIECLSYVDTRSLVRSRSVCKSLCVVINSSLSLRYRIGLHFDAAIDAGHTVRSTAERFKQHLASRNAWANLTWKKATYTPALGDCSAYEVVCGSFVRMLWGREFSVLELPTRETEPLVQQRPDIAGSIKDFALDPSQDVMVYLEDDDSAPSLTEARTMTMHIRTFSTLKTHPNAKFSRLPFHIFATGRSSNILGIVTIQLMDDTLGLFIRYPFAPSRLVIWNWNTGQLLLDDGESEMMHKAVHFSFIDTQSFLIPSASGDGEIHVSQIHDGTLKSWVTLKMPPLRPGAKLEFFNTHSSALPRNPTGISPDQDRRIHSFTALYSGSSEPHLTYCLFVHNNYFRRLLQQSSILGCMKVPWKTWAPDNTRFLPLGGMFHWMRYVSGQKVVCPVSSDSPREIKVFDFNIHLSAIQPDTPTRSSVTEPTILEGGELFKRQVRTSLPFYCLHRLMPKKYSGYMIDEDRIIGLKTRETADGLELETIDVFCL